jgi:hypothetical protein
MDPDERTKTGCMGILLPMATAAYGAYRIAHPRKVSYLFHTPITSPSIAVGVCALGIALFVHGLGFVPYERIRFLKYLIATLGIVLFIVGLFWEQIDK